MKDDGYSAQREAAYAVLYPVYRERYAKLSAGLQASVLQLLERLIEVGKPEGDVA